MSDFSLKWDHVIFNHQFSVDMLVFGGVKSTELLTTVGGQHIIPSMPKCTPWKIKSWTCGSDDFPDFKAG